MCFCSWYECCLTSCANSFTDVDGRKVNGGGEMNISDKIGSFPVGTVAGVWVGKAGRRFWDGRFRECRSPATVISSTDRVEDEFGSSGLTCGFPVEGAGGF